MAQSGHFLRIKLVSVLDYIPIGAVSSVVLYINQGGVLINPQGKVALFMSASVLRSPSSAHLL